MATGLQALRGDDAFSNYLPEPKKKEIRKQTFTLLLQTLNR